MFAPVAGCLFITGEINQGSITTQATTTDSAIKLSTLAGFTYANVPASGADLDAQADSFYGNSLASNHCTGQ